MSSALFRWRSCGALCILVLASCSLDDRPLNYEFHALLAAGASGGGSSGVGAGDAGAPANGDAGTPAAGGDSGGDPGPGDAGSPIDGGGSANTGGVSGLAGAGANAGATSSNSGSGGTGGGTGGGAPASGAGNSSGGAAFVCGDLNHDFVDDCSETLVQNSRFDTSATPWVAESSLTATWGNVNATGAPGSGSISLNHTGPGGTMIGARQCMPVTPNALYDVAARVQVGAGQTGTAGINVYFYDDDACQANFVIGNTPIEGGVPGTWTELATVTPLWIPGAAHSMYVRLVADKPLNQTTPLTVLIDDVLVAKRVMP